jgi:hypothetical protein
MAFDYVQFTTAFPWFFPVAAFLIGACIGSFLNVVIYRVPKEESIVFPPSRCPHCGTACAGVFDGAPGHWGAKRRAVRILE